MMAPQAVPRWVLDRLLANADANEAAAVELRQLLAQMAQRARGAALGASRPITSVVRLLSFGCEPGRPAPSRGPGSYGTCAVLTVVVCARTVGATTVIAAGVGPTVGFTLEPPQAASQSTATVASHCVICARRFVLTGSVAVTFTPAPLG
jgi:hypothetical protein